MDGALLPDEEARALWTQFSQHMDANEGDLAGFAREKGWISVSPEYRKGQAVLVVKTTSRGDSAGQGARSPPPASPPSGAAPTGAGQSSGTGGQSRKRRRRR